MVRCWSQDTLLNGRVFSDERLCPGDRLAIGPIEVEVLDLGGSKSSATAPTGLAPADIAPFSVNRFPCPPRDTQHEIALEPPRPAPRGQSTDPQELADRAVQFDAREADLAIRQRRLDDSYHRWRAKQDAAEAELTRRNEEISSQKEGLASQRALLDEQRRQWEAERSGVQLRLDQQSRRSDARLAELEEQVQALEQERNRWEARQDAADADLARRKEKLAAEQAELANQRAALDEQRRQWEAEQVAVQQQGDQHGQQSDARLAELQEQVRALEQERHQCEADQTAGEADLARRKEELAAEQAELANQRAALDEQRRQWEAEQVAVQQQGDQHGQQSDARLAELQEQVRALEQERHQCEADQTAGEADLARRKEELAAEQAELANQRAALDEQRGQWEAEQVAVQQQGDQHGQQSDARLAELQEQVRALEQERHQCEADQTAGEADLARRKEELAAEQAELANQRAALDEQRHQWEAERSEKEAEFAERVQRLDAQQAELDAATLPESRRPDPDEPTIAPAGELAPRQESRLEEAPKEASFSSLELLRRLGKMPSFLDEDESPTEHAASDSDRTGADEMPQNPGGAEGRASLPDDGLASSHAGSEEESVDQYMAKLLARMRGEVAATKGREAPSPADRGERGRRNAEREDTRAAAGPAAEAVHTIGAKLQEPVEMSPRAVAPEKSVNLTALREVANLSADNAIDRHARKRLFHIVAKKLTVSLLALLASLALIAAWWLRLAHPLALYAGSVSLIVAILWGLYYPLMSSRMIHGQPQALARKRPRNETPLAPDPSADWYAGPQPPTKDEV